MAGKSANNAIFIKRHLQGKYKVTKKRLPYVFVDVEKSFEMILRRAIICVLLRQSTQKGTCMDSNCTLQKLKIKEKGCWRNIRHF